MSATWTLEKTNIAQVQTPPAGKVRFFIDDADNLCKYKDELGVVRVTNADVASALLTADTPNPFIVDGSTPVAGDIMIADSPIAGTWRNPRYIPGVVVLNSVTPETGNFSALLGRIHIVDVSGGSVVAALPPANAGSLNMEIWFKLVGNNGGNVLTLNPDGAETIDVSESSIDLTLTREWAKLRSMGNGNWMQFS